MLPQTCKFRLYCAINTSLKPLLSLRRKINDPGVALQVYSAARFGASFVQGVIITRLLSQAEVGRFEFGLLTISAAAFWWLNSLINVYLPAFAQAEPKERFVLRSGLFAALFLLSTLVFGGLAVYSVSLGQSPPFYLFIGWLSAPALSLEYLLLADGKLKVMLMIGLSSLLIGLLAVASAISIFSSLQAALIALAILAMCRFLVAWLLSKPTLSSLKHPLFRGLFGKALPVGGTLLLGGSLRYVDAFFAKYFTGSSGYAIFSIGAREVPLAILLANALSNTLSANISISHQAGSITEGLQEVKQKTEKLMHTVFPLSALGILMVPWLFHRLYPIAYGPAASLFAIYLLMAIHRVMLPQSILYGLGKTKALLRASIAEFMVNLVLDAILGYYFGLVGIVWAGFIAFAMERIIQIQSLRKLGIHVGQYAPIRSWLLYTLLMCVCFVLSGAW